LIFRYDGDEKPKTLKVAGNSLSTPIHSTSFLMYEAAEKNEGKKIRHYLSF
jgi:hypothetical protein